MEATTEKEPNWVSGMGWGSLLAPGHRVGERTSEGDVSPYTLGGTYWALNSGPIVQMGTLRWAWIDPRLPYLG